jgi:hypothetical protein
MVATQLPTLVVVAVAVDQDVCILGVQLLAVATVALE